MNYMKLQKSVQITLIIAAAVIILTIIGIVYFNSTSTSDTIQVNGQATSKVSPDLISVYFNVQTKGATSKEASDANTLIVNKLTANLVALGFSESDLTTESYNIYPEYDYTNGQKFLDYAATNSLKIELPVSQKSKTSSVVDAGTNAGAGISYINFELTPALQQSAKKAAIENASIDARTKAEALASGFNKQLGRLVSVSLDQFNYNPWPIYASSDSSGGGVSGAPAAKSAAANINPSNQDVSASVTAVYKLM
jgi:uncharacterized protein YggE